MSERDSGFPLGEPIETPEDLIVIGKVSGFFGVQGWMKIFSDTSPKENILQYRPWYLLRKGQCWHVKVAGGRTQGKGLVARLKGINYRDQVGLLQGMEIAIPRSALPKLEENEYYWSDLVGLAVQTVDGQDLGQVDYLFETGANDVIVVKGDKERLIPYVTGDVVKTVDLDAGQMIVEWDPEF